MTIDKLADVTFRRGRPDDAGSIVAVARDCWHATYDDILGPATVEATLKKWYDIDDIIRSTETEGHVVEVADANPVVAFAHAGPHPDMDGALLYRLYADPGWWGTGIGTRLVDRTLDRLSDRWNRVRAVVISENSIGVAFYESYGWNRIETREETVSGVTVDEYVYQYELGHATD